MFNSYTQSLGIRYSIGKCSTKLNLNYREESKIVQGFIESEKELKQFQHINQHIQQQFNQNNNLIQPDQSFNQIQINQNLNQSDQIKVDQFLQLIKEFNQQSLNEPILSQSLNLFNFFLQLYSQEEITELKKNLDKTMTTQTKTEPNLEKSKLFGYKLENIQNPPPSDIEISSQVPLKPIEEIASILNIQKDELILYGQRKAKIDYSKVLKRLENQENGYYVLVTGMTPTSLGEGKTTTTVGLAQALGAYCNRPSVASIREPSTGPCFGIKGGGAGGGYSQVVPMDDLNLHLTGDIHAVSSANNLLAAAIDSRWLHESISTDEQLFTRMCPKESNGKRKFSPIMLKRLKKLGISETDPDKLTPEEKSKFVRLDIDPDTISWNRGVDMNDRHLRKIIVGLADTENKLSRETQFDITVASEVMGILALTTGIPDMKQRFANIVVAKSKSGELITAEDLGVSGAMSVLMKDAINPNLMQTLEGTPAIIHAGPFANIAVGNSSIIGDLTALKLVGPKGFVLTEAGFGADIGAEKFMHIKCRKSGIKPNCIVITTTIRALKVHGGCNLLSSKQENLEALEKGLPNLGRHIENMNKFGVPVIVCINQFSFDSENEVDRVKKFSIENGAYAVEQSNHWAEGGKGAVDIAKLIIQACETEKSNFKFLYDLNSSIKEKIETVAKEIYRATSVEYSELAEKKIQQFTESGANKLPICIAKTQYSFGSDIKAGPTPTDFKIFVRDIRCYYGAGYIVPLLGEISTMPGFGTRPAYYDIDLTDEGEIIGLM